MAISDDNIRIQVTFPKTLKARLDELAKDDNRSFGNYVVTVLKRHVESLEEDKK
jgi:hypothetical protein